MAFDFIATRKAQNFETVDAMVLGRPVKPQAKDRVVSQFEKQVGTGPHPRPATHANILSLGGRAGVRAGAGFKLRHYEGTGA